MHECVLQPFVTGAIRAVLYVSAFVLQVATSVRLGAISPVGPLPRWFCVPAIKPPSWALFLVAWGFLALLIVRRHLLVLPIIQLPPELAARLPGPTSFLPHLNVNTSLLHLVHHRIDSGMVCGPRVVLSARYLQHGMGLPPRKRRLASNVGGNDFVHAVQSPLQCALLVASYPECGHTFLFSVVGSEKRGCRCCRRGANIRRDLKSGVQDVRWDAWHVKKLPFESLTPSASAAVAGRMGISYHLARSSSVCPPLPELLRPNGTNDMRKGFISLTDERVESPLQCALMAFNQRQCGSTFLWSPGRQGVPFGSCRCCHPSATLEQLPPRSTSGACLHSNGMNAPLRAPCPCQDDVIRGIPTQMHADCSACAVQARVGTYGTLQVIPPNGRVQRRMRNMLGRRSNW